MAYPRKIVPISYIVLSNKGNKCEVFDTSKPRFIKYKVQKSDFL